MTRAIVHHGPKKWLSNFPSGLAADSADFHGFSAVLCTRWGAVPTHFLHQPMGTGARSEERWGC